MRERAGANPKRVFGAINEAAAAHGAARPLEAGSLGYNMTPTKGPGGGGDPLDRAAAPARGPGTSGDPGQRAMGPHGHRPPPPTPGSWTSPGVYRSPDGSVRGGAAAEKKAREYGAPSYGDLPPPPTNATGKSGSLSASRSRVRDTFQGMMGWNGPGSQGAAPTDPDLSTPLDAGNMGRGPAAAKGSPMADAYPTLNAFASTPGKVGVAAAGAMIGFDAVKFGFLGDEGARSRFGLPPARDSRLSHLQERLSAEGLSGVYGPGSDALPRHSVDTSTINAWAATQTGQPRVRNRKALDSYDYINEPRDVRVVNDQAQPLGVATSPGSVTTPSAGAGPGSTAPAMDYMHSSQTQGGNPWFDTHQQAVNGIDIQSPQPIRKPQTP